MNRRPLALVTISWVAGSACLASLGTRGAVLAGAALAAWLLALAVSGLLSRRLAAACLAAYVLAAGQRAWTDARNTTALADLQAAYDAEFPPQAEAAGTIASAVEVDGDRVSFRADVDTVRADGDAPRRLRERVQVTVRLAEQPDQDVAAGWRRGDRVTLSGELTRPDEATNFGGFDYRRYLYSQRIHWLLRIDGVEGVRIDGRETATVAAALGRVDAARDWMGARMERLFPEELHSGYMKGLVLGLRDDLDPELFRQFSQLGLTHILAISGLHVAVFLYGLGTVLRALRLSRETTLEALAAAVPFYVLLSGASPSVMRAGIMAVLGLVAARLNRLKDGLNLLAAAALLMLIWNPYYITDVSFQLSFTVTAGLIIGVPPVRRMLPHPKRGRALLDLLAVSVVAQLVSFPLSIYYFNQFHLLSLPANMVLVPFISTIVLPVGSAALLVSLLWMPAGQVAAFAAQAANNATFAAVELMGRADRLGTIWASPPVWWLCAWYAGLLLLFRRLGAFGGEAAEAAAGDAPGAAAGLTAAGLAGAGLAGAGSGAAGGAADVPRGGAHGAGPQAASGGDAGAAAAQATRPLAAHPLGGPPPAAYGGGSPARSAGASAPPAQPLAADAAGRAPADDETRPLGTLPARRRAGQPLVRLALAAAPLAALLVYAYAPDRFDRSATVSFLDVGQGDAIHIRLPDGGHMLVDGGGTMNFRKPEEAWKERRDPFEVGRKVVVPLLMKRGVHSIDTLVISHLDTDHIGGLRAVLESIPVKRIVWNGTIKRSKDAVSLLALAAEKRIPLYRAADAPPLIPLDRRASAAVLWPEPYEEAVSGGAPAPLREEEEQNEASVLLRLKLYETTFLLTGDIDAAGERAVLANVARAVEDGSAPRELAAPVDIMKIAHHGSKTSTTDEWVRFWQPAAAAISVGRRNVYGHPYPAVIKRLEDHGLPIWRTDSGGEIQFRVTADGAAVRAKLREGAPAL